MILPFVAASLTLSAAEPVEVRRLADVPNMRVSYYDVTGRDVMDINRSITAKRAQHGKEPIPATSQWAVATNFTRRAVGGQCKVEAAEAKFSATAELPRLVDREKVPPKVIKQWETYAEGLEATQVPMLMFVYSQLDAVRDTMLASSCDDAKAVGAAAVAQLRKSAAAFEVTRQAQTKRTQRMFANAQLFGSPTDRLVCRSLGETGTRIAKVRTCMSAREWELLWKDSARATHDMQNALKHRPPGQ